MSPVQAPEAPHSRSPFSASSGSVGRRRRRKAWAGAHEAEYLREDPSLAGEWPLSLLGLLDPSLPERIQAFVTTGRLPDATAPIPPVVLGTQLQATDVLSGFYRGHLLHIADIGGATVMALRRLAYSPVSVHYSVPRGGQRPSPTPYGLRRCELLDQAPFAAFTDDVRALDRMLDVRAEDALFALSEVVTDVAWGGEWVVARLVPRLDMAVWEELPPYLVTLADSAMVLPPEVTTVLLEWDAADPTRPDLASGLALKTCAPDALPPAQREQDSGGPGAQGNQASRGASAAASAGAGTPAGARNTPGASTGGGAAFGGDGPGAGADRAGAAASSSTGGGAAGAATTGGGTGNRFIRAVPDPAERSASGGAGATGTPETSADASEPSAGAASASPSEPASGSPAGFTTAPDGASAAEPDAASASAPRTQRPEVPRPAESVTFPTRFAARAEGDTGALTDSALGATPQGDGPQIPPLGEDPSHIEGPRGSSPRVSRASEPVEATIFEDVEDVPSTAVRLNPVATRRRASGGRHRAPEARHARPAPIQPMEGSDEEIETVDGEIVLPSAGDSGLTRF